MKLTDENLDEDDCRPTPETFAIRIEMPDYMAERIEQRKQDAPADD